MIANETVEKGVKVVVVAVHRAGKHHIGAGSQPGMTSFRMVGNFSKVSCNDR